MITNRYPQDYIDTLEAQEGTIIYNLDTNNLDIRSGLDWLPIGSGGSSPSYSDDLFFISTKSDLPTPIEGVIYLANYKTYFFVAEVDLLGDRLVCGIDTTILGTSSENARIKSTGLVGVALITSNYSMPLRGITIEADIALDLQGDGVTTALDWFGVNFTDCNNVGLISNYSNFIMTDSSFLNSGGLTFDGSIGTIGIFQTLFECNPGNTAITIAPTANITRRFRIIYSSIFVLPGETGINFSPLATIGNERYILDTVNFAGGGSYLVGLTDLDNKSLFTSCVGIENSASIAEYYMVDNLVATDIITQNVFTKLLGSTLPGVYVRKFTLTNNRATYTGALTRFFKVSAIATLVGGSNIKLLAKIAKNGVVIDSSQGSATTSGNARAENIKCHTIVQLVPGDYIEFFVANGTNTNDITGSDLNVIIEAIN